MRAFLVWLLISAGTTATVYNAVPDQCNSQPTVTASGRRITGDVAALRWLAMERTMMARHDIHYGDTILVKGAGVYDGEWVVEDTMHPRWAGQDRVDFLVPESVRLGRWEGVKIYRRAER